jgi:hypothetical protein
MSRVISTLLIALLFFLPACCIGAANAASPLGPIKGTKRVTVVVSLTNRSSFYKELTESDLAEFIRDLVTSRLQAEPSPARKYERGRPDLPVAVIPWSEFNKQFTSDWDLVFLWKISIDPLQDTPTSPKQVIVSYLLTYDFLDCNRGVIRPHTTEQTFLSSWIAGPDLHAFYIDLAKDLDIYLSPAVRDLREDTYVSTDRQFTPDEREDLANSLVADMVHVEVGLEQGGDSIFTLDRGRDRLLEGWTVSTVRTEINEGLPINHATPIAVDVVPAGDQERSRILTVQSLMRDYPKAAAERKFTFLTLAVILRWSRRTNDALLTMGPVSIRIPEDIESYERSYRSALSAALDDIRKRITTNNP